MDTKKTDIYAMGLNVQRIRAYTLLAEKFNIHLSTVGQIFNEGADWALEHSKEEKLLELIEYAKNKAYILHNNEDAVASKYKKDISKLYNKLNSNII